MITNLSNSSFGIYFRLWKLFTNGFYAGKSWGISSDRRHFENQCSTREPAIITFSVPLVPRDLGQFTNHIQISTTKIPVSLFIVLGSTAIILKFKPPWRMWEVLGSLHASMSRKFRPTSLGSQSGIYSVRGSELARSGKTTPNQIRCVVELLDDSEFVIDIDVSKWDFC